MQSDYKDKLMEMISIVLANVSESLSEEDREKFSGVGPIAIMVSAQMICIAKGYKESDMESFYESCETISRAILKEWNIEPEAKALPKAPATTQYKN